MRYYGAEPAPTVASHAQQLKFLLSSAIDSILPTHWVGNILSMVAHSPKKQFFWSGPSPRKASLLLKGVLGCTR